MPQGEHNASKTHCDHGHKFTPENTKRDKHGWRSCRTCTRASQRASAARARAAGAPLNMRGSCPRCGGSKSKSRTVRMCAACASVDGLAQRTLSTIEGFQRYVALYGRPPTSLEWPYYCVMLGGVTTTQVQEDFGSWSEGLRAAGLDPQQRMRERPTPPRVRAAPKDGNARQARTRIASLVAGGHIPQPNSLPCKDCGRAFTANGPRHEYDHHLGYAAEHHEDVEVVCMPCHRARDAALRRQARAAA